MVSVDAAYFVSGYEDANLGEHGVLGLIGSDGIFLVRRSGETVTANDRSHYGLPVMHAADEVESEATPQTNAWDGVRRYTSAHEHLWFPPGRDRRIIRRRTIGGRSARTNKSICGGRQSAAL